MCVAHISIAQPRKPPAPKVDPEVAKQKIHADALYAAAQQFFAGGAYNEAIEQFTQAYAIVHDPVFLYNIALSYRKLDRCVEASSYYHQYLLEEPEASNRGRVEQWLRELQPCVEERNRATQEQADRVRREAEDAYERRKPRPTAVDTGFGLRLSGMVVGGVGLAALAVGAGYAHHGGVIEDEIARACAATTTCNWDGKNDPQDAKDQAGHTANKVAAGFLIGGGIAALTGAGLYYLGFHRTETVLVVPRADGGASVLVGGRF